MSKIDHMNPGHSYSEVNFETQVILKAFMELFKLRRELAGRQLRSAK